MGLINIDELKFDESGLIPAVVTDAETGELLMLAYMSRESLEISIEKGLACFWSRSRQELWLKGETSGNYQHIVSIRADCDLDALELRVNKDGPACHTGADSCFHNDVLPCGAKTPVEAGSGGDEFSLRDLMKLISDRKFNPREGSYTTYLFDKGLDKILKKVGEESAEVIIAAKNDTSPAADAKNPAEETIYEVADLVYHVMVMMIELGISLDDVRGELASRHVIDRKLKQEKMK